MAFDEGSFRDPSGRILRHEGRIFRAIFRGGIEPYRAALEGGMLDELANSGLLLPSTSVSLDEVPRSLRSVAPDAVEWLEHPLLPFVSYPYEWSFGGLKAAALLHLNLHIKLLEKGFTLSDATAYNVQFLGTQPIFIDHLSIVPYVDGSPWIGQRQFGMQFLNPLYLWSSKGVAPHAWYRGSVEGIAPEELSKLLGLKDKMSFTVLAHIIGPAAFAKRRNADSLNGPANRKALLPKGRLIALLLSLRDYIAKLTPPYEKTVWDDYADHNSYDTERRQAKHQFVENAVKKASPKLLFDVGCNSGDFSQTALSAGAVNVVGFDFDLSALEKAYTRFSKSQASVLPLWLDATNPSPSQGWAGMERKSLASRAPADHVLALAVIHHLAIARNIPLDMAVDWLMSLGQTGVVEFPSKSDAMVQQLLRHREDIFPNYSEAAFLECVSSRGRIVQTERLGVDGRLIIAFDKRQ